MLAWLAWRESRGWRFPRLATGAGTVLLAAAVAGAGGAVGLAGLAGVAGAARGFGAKQLELEVVEGFKVVSSVKIRLPYGKPVFVNPFVVFCCFVEHVFCIGHAVVEDHFCAFDNCGVYGWQHPFDLFFIGYRINW